MSSDYDGHDQAYQDLLDENDTLRKEKMENYRRQMLDNKTITDLAFAFEDAANESVALEIDNKKLRAEIENIASLIHFQAPLNAQDKWLADVIEYGFYTPEQEEE